MTPDLLDRATREACQRLGCTGPPPAPQHRADVYADAVMRLVEAGRRGGEDFHGAYLRVRTRPSAAVVALVLIHREQFERERRVLMH